MRPNYSGAIISFHLALQTAHSSATNAEEAELQVVTDILTMAE